MEKELFRKEALNHRRHTLFGGAIVQRPLSFSILAWMTGLFVLALIAFLIWGQYTRKQTVRGYLVPDSGLIEVYAPSDGIISERHVQDGMSVKKGQVLFVVSTRRSTAATPDVGNALIQAGTQSRDALQEQIRKTRELGEVQQQQLKLHIASLKDDLSHTQAELTTEKARYAIAQAEYDKIQALKGRGYISDTQLQTQHDHVLQEQSSVESLEKALDDTNQQINDANLSLSVLPLQNSNQVAGYEKDLAALDQQNTELQAKHEMVVQAPADGVATGVFNDPGQSVSSTSLLLTILPAGSSLEARLFVPTAAAGFIKTGQHVLLRYEAFPYQHFGMYRGTIKDVSQSIVRTSQLGAPISMDEPVYPVTVSLDRQFVDAYGQKVPLQAGMLLNADVILNRQHLISWILEPLYSLHGSLSQ